MPYTPTTWSTGNSVTAALLNNIETGIGELRGVVSLNVKAYGAVGDWSSGTTGTDNYTAINNCLTAAAALVAAGAASVRVTVPWTTGNGYKFGTPIVTPAGVEWDMRAPLVYTGATGQTALTIGSSTAELRRRHVIQLKRYTLTDWTSESDAGLVIRNHYVSEFRILMADNFTVGVTCIGDNSNGFSYNKLWLGQLTDNKIALDLTNDTSGWCNENQFYGGRFTCQVGTYTSLDRVGVRITSRATTKYYNNANTFYSPSFELKGGAIAADSVCMLVEYGSHNEATRARHESNSPAVLKQQNDSVSNWIDFQYSDEGAVAPTFSAEGTSAGGGLTQKKAANVDRSMRLIYKADNLHKKACYYDGGTSINVPGLTVGTSGTTNTDARAASSLVLNANYLEIPNTRYAGFYMSTRELKRFAVFREAESGFGGRIMIRAYDSGGTIISTAGAVQTVKVADNPTYATSYGGAWRLGNDSNAPYFFAVSAATDYVFIGITGGTAAARIRALTVATHEATNPATWLAFEDHGYNYATTVPTSGTWEVGRLLFHATPTTTGPVGWVCTTAGSPGTWRSFGDIPGQLEFMSSLGSHPSFAMLANASQIFVANQALLMEFIPYRNITVTGLRWITGTATSGNYDIGILSSTGTRLWSKGSTAWPAINTAIVETVSPSVAMTAGTMYYLVLAGDNTTGTFRGTGETVANAALMLDSTDQWAKSVTSSFPIPSSLTPGNSRSGKAPLIVVHGT